MKIIGSIVGDVVGSRFEFDNIRTKDFRLFTNDSHFTDDTVLTIATMDWLNNGDDNSDCSPFLVKWSQLYPDVAYGSNFISWIKNHDHKCYGNGAAMRVSPIGNYARYEGAADVIAYYNAICTHSKDDAINGARAIAFATNVAKKKIDKDFCRIYMEALFKYDLSSKLSSDGAFDTRCNVTVPLAIKCFLEENSFEDVLRTAISLGGDSDTIACMACGIAGAYYDVPKDIEAETMDRLPKEFIDVIYKFESTVKAEEEKLAAMYGKKDWM